ncbi:MAG: hypothetical protein ACFE9Q_10975 [Candidatus Hodarchaeota archaeon]
MVIKENNWIGTHQGDTVVQDPSCNKTIIMVMMFLGFVAYNPITLSL